jgi:hypothetical protein
MATAITYVGVGTVSATDGGSNPTPALPTGLVDNDLMLTFFYSREIVDGTISISAGWTQIVNQRDAAGLMAVWYRFRQAADAAPTLTLGGHVGGASGDTAIAQIAAWRGVLTTDPIHATGALTTNIAALNIGPIPGVAVNRKGLVIAFGGKLDDFTSVATLSGDDLDWQEVAEPDTTSGSDAGMVWDYAISTQLEIIVANKTFTVSGGTSVSGKGFMISFNLDFDAFVAATDIIAYAAQSHPQNDSGAVGGGIDPLMRVTFTDLGSADDLEALSADAGDTTTSITVRGRDAGGVLVVESKTLNGTTPVVLSTLGIIERVETIQLSGPALGAVTIRRSPSGATVATIPINEIGVRRVFAFSFAHPGIAKNYYEKVFIKNAHSVRTLNNAVISESGDPTGLVTFVPSAIINDIAIANSRITAPDVADTLDPDVFDNNNKYVPGLSLDPDDAIGVWVKLNVAAGLAPFKNTYQLTLSGSVI